ncbi:MAG: hypothetical protein QOH33_1429, partial [Paraburkholderia sp.]|nr:hypothetical protein [Paraburkholderia sp.]
VGLSGEVEFINPAAERLLDCEAKECAHRPLDTLVSLTRERDRRPLDLISAALTNPGPDEHGSDLMLTSASGKHTIVQAVTSVVRDASDAPTGIVLLLRNMSREREYISNLAWQATHDGLTGLLNRTEFERCLDASLNPDSQLDNSERACALMVLDLDQFKVVNDTFGHAAGDAMLKDVALRIRQCLRQRDVLGRLGGDEFGVLLQEGEPAGAAEVAERVRKDLAAFEWSWGTHVVSTSVSIGVVDLRQDDLDVEKAMRFGDIACYMAKERGRDRVHLAVAGDKELNRHASEISWARRIKDALAHDGFCLYAQAICATASFAQTGGHVTTDRPNDKCRAEILLRMTGDSGEVIPPGLFMPAAERYGLMSAIDRWVVHAVFTTLANTEQHPESQYSINLSGASVGDERFLEFLNEQFLSTGIPPTSICFEVTETTAVANLGAAAHFIRELKKRGCKFALDDFGAGMSSFGYLKHLPVDYVKIDGGFIKDMLKDPVNREMVTAINDIGHSMGRMTIAEYVESESILAALRGIGVDYVQGYHVGRPALWVRDVDLFTV